MKSARLLSTFVLLAVPTVAAAEKECIVVPTAPIIGTTSSFSTTSGALQPEEEITSIQIRFETGSGIFSADTDDVWLDIGPRAWKVGDDFGSGTSKTVSLNEGDIKNAYFNLSPGAKLKVKDIAYIRIEKKGICGLTDAPDSLLDLLFPGGATPANLLPQALGDVDKAQTALGAANNALQLHLKAVQAEQAAIDKLAGTISDLQSKQTSIEKQALDVRTGILQKQHDLETGAVQHFENVVVTTADKVCSGWKKVLFGLGPCLAWGTVQHTHIIQKVTQAWIDATQWIVDQQARADSLGKQALDIQNSITKASTEQAAHSATLGQLLADKTAEGAVTKTSEALDTAKLYFQELNDLAQKALSGIQVPQPGQWNLHAVTVAVNGKVLSSFSVDRRLKRNSSSVISYLRPLSPEDEFVFGLRANVPQEQSEEGPNSDEIAAGVTTPFFKDNGISGWQSRPLAAASAIGTLRHKPSPGADGFVSLDLQLEQVEARGKTYRIAEMDAPRFLRIEYSNVSDTRYLQWPIGTRLRVQGNVLWDTDQYGFYELHPTRASQVNDAADTDTLTGVPDVVTAVAKARWWIVRLFSPKMR